MSEAPLSLEETLRKRREEKPKDPAPSPPVESEEPFRYKVFPELKQLENSEGADAYWKRNDTCVNYLKSLILTKISEEQLQKITWSCHNIDGVSEEFMDECWTKIEHPEWFGTGDYFIKPYLALCVQLELGDSAYKFLNDGQAFPRMSLEEWNYIQAKWKEIDALGKKKESQPPTDPHPQPETPPEDELPCASEAFTEEDCAKCLDPCTGKCSLGVSLSQAGKDDACLTCQTRSCEKPVEAEKPQSKPVGLESFL